jgi:hypothetical protein
VNTRKTSSLDAKNTPKRERRRFWPGCFTILLASPLLLYYGYCWGLWGRQSLLLQYLFQCKCPPANEEARYPEEVDVVIPACQNLNTTVRLLPSGRFLYLNEERQGINKAYLLNLETMERSEVTNQPFSSFLTDDLWFIEGGIEDYILDRTTEVQYPIRDFRYWREDAYFNGKPNLDLLVFTLHQAEQIFFIQSSDVVIVLMGNFPTNMEQNFTFGRSHIPGWGSDQVERFLNENHVVYQTILADYPEEVVSLDNRFVARPDGIYLLHTGQKIVDAHSISNFYRPYSGKYLALRGWTYDGQGVIYSQFPLGPCLIETNFFIMDDTGCFNEVSQPVLKLKVPEEYLTSGETP